MPGFPLVRAILWSQVLNGMLLPLILIFMLLLVNRPRIMREWINSQGYNAVALVAVVVLIALTLALTILTFTDLARS